MIRQDESPSLVFRIDTLNAGGMVSFEQTISQQLGRRVKVEIGHLEIDSDTRVGVWVFSPETNLPPYFRQLSAEKLAAGDLADCIAYLETELMLFLGDAMIREANQLPSTLWIPKTFGAKPNA